MHGVVVGVSGSTESEVALDWALSEAAWRSLPLTAIQAWTGPRDTQPHEYQALLERQREDLLASVDAAMRRTGLTEVEFTSAVVESDATDALLIAGGDCNMLVLGRRRLGRFGRLMLGSVSSEVVERAEVPVTVVRSFSSDDDDVMPALDPTGTPRVVVGVDTSGSSLLALQHAAQYARATGAVLEAVHAWQLTTLSPVPSAWNWAPPIDDFHTFATEQLDAAIDAAHLDLPAEQLVKTVVHKSPAAALVEASTAASRLVVGARGLGGFDRLLLGSVSRQVLEYASCPVTVVR